MFRWSVAAVAAAFCVASSVLILSGSPEQKKPAYTPVPTDIAGNVGRTQKESQQWRNRRNVWIEHMHRSSPSVRWRDIDADYRQQMTAQRLARRLVRQQAGAPLAKSTVLLRDGLIGVWSERGSANLAGRTVTTIYDADVDELLLYSDGGHVWSADHATLDWNSLDDNLRLVGGGLERFTGAQERLIVASASPTGIYGSDNRGQTWNGALVDVTNPIRVRSIVVPDPIGNNLIAAFQHWHWIGSWVQAVTLYTSTNRGDTVQQLGTTGQFENGSAVSLFSPRYDSTATYMIVAGDVFSIDIAAPTITPIGTVPIGFSPASVHNAALSGGVDSAGNTFLYAAYDLGSSTQVFRSTDAGVNWVFAGSAPTFLFRGTSFASSSRDPDKLLLGGIDAYYSHNGGASWTLINSWIDYYSDIENSLHADIVGVNHYVDANGDERVYINTDGGTYLSMDGGQTVSNLSLSGLGVSQYYSSLTQRTPPYAMYAGAQDQGFQKAEMPVETGPVSFRQSISGDYGHLVTGDGGVSLWTVYPTFAMRYPNAAGSDTARFWDFSPNGLSSVLWLPPLVADPLNPAVVYLAGGNLGGGGHRIIRLQDQGSFVSSSQGSYDFGSLITAMAISPVDAQRRYVVNDGQDFFVSNDGGVSWQTNLGFAAPDNHYFYGSTILASKVDVNRLWVAGSGYSGPAVFESTDGGQSFTPFATGMPDTLVYDLDVSPDDAWLFAATEVGAFFYDTTTGTWVDAIQTIGPDQVYWDVDYIAPLQTARFATYGRGLWDLRVQYVRRGGKSLRSRN